MAELLTGKTLFPGDDHIDQLTKIMQLIGKPSDEFLKKITSNNARTYIQSMPNYHPKNFREYFRNASNHAVEILTKMLTLDPDERPTAAQALAHPYFQAYHDPEDEPTAPPFDEGFSAEHKEVTIDQLKELIFEEIRTFVPPPPTEDDMDM